MKRLKRLLVLLSVVWTIPAWANHLCGGWMEYTYLGNNVYRIDLYMIRDCSGQLYFGDPEFYVKNDCGTTCYQDGYIEEIGIAEAVNYGCGNTCDIIDSGLPGYKIGHFRKDITLSSACDSWTVSCAIGSRNDVDLAAAGGTYYTYCKINNTVSNNSPTIIGSPLIMGCTNWGATSEFSFSPTGGDQIVYELASPLNAQTSSRCNPVDVVYDAGYSYLNPFPSSTPLALNSSNGSISLTPTMTGSSYFGVIAKEYRNGVQIGEQLIDGVILSQSCQPGGHVTFGSFPSSGTATKTIDGIEEFCETIELSADGPITSVSVEGSHTTYTVTNGPNNTKLVELCVQLPPEFLCPEADLSITVTAYGGESDDCLAAANNVGDRGYYYIHKQKGEFCPENLYFTNRNSTSGLVMPSYAKAQDYIYVGDSMPPPPLYDPQTDGPEGYVIISGSVELTAGIDVIIPSCHGGPQAGCVQIGQGTTIYIKPNSCSSECDPEPLEFIVQEVFECGEERLIAHATGDGPFTYHWNVNGNLFTRTDNKLDIHDIVSAVNGSQISYTCEVFDAAGNSGIVSGQVWGTKRFYEDIHNNTTWWDFDPNTVNGPDGFYYGASIFCTPDHPAYIADLKNSTPPWYGATEMVMTIWGANGQVIYEKSEYLEGGEDWSIDNYSFYWIGRQNNSVSQPCVYIPSGVAEFNYQLEARNCFTVIQEEEAVFTFMDPYLFAEGLPLGCTDGPVITDWINDTIQIAKVGSISSDDPRKEGLPSIDKPVTNSVSTGDFYVYCVPNPTKTSFEIRSNQTEFRNVQLLDQSGKEVMKFTTLATGEKINVESLSSGMYMLVLEGNHLKIIKE